MAKFKIIKISAKENREKKLDQEYLTEAAKLLGFKNADDMKAYIDKHGTL